MNLDSIKRTLGLLAAALAAGCGGGPPVYARLDGMLGYAEFYLLCVDEQRCEGESTVPAFAIGSTYDFEVELSSDFPYHEAGANVEIHAGDARFVDGVEKQTVMAISKHTDRYLVDYAHVYLYEANLLALESTGEEPLRTDADGVYLIPLGGTVEADIVAYHDAQRLSGQLSYDARSLDTTRLSVGLGRDSTVRLTGVRTGTATLVVTGIGHTEQFRVRVTSGPRTNPPPPEDPPSPPRTNPTPADTDGDTDTDTDTDTEATTGTGSDTDTDTDTDGTTSGTGTGGMG